MAEPPNIRYSKTYIILDLAKYGYLIDNMPLSLACLCPRVAIREYVKETLGHGVRRRSVRRGWVIAATEPKATTIGVSDMVVTI